MWRIASYSLAAVLLSCSAAWSQQQSKPADSAGMMLMRQAYDLTKTARTEADLTRVIELCQQGFESPLNAGEDKYGKSLMAWALNRRGEVRADAGNEEESLADFESSISFDPARWNAYHNRGVSLGMAGRFEDALADFNRVIKMKPDHAKAYFNRGEIQFNQGNLAGALEDYNLCLRYAPRDSAALNSRGFVYYKQRNYQAAIRDYSQALQSNPSNAEAYTNRGDAQADVGQFAQAVRDYQAAVRADANFGRAYQSSGWLRATCPDPQIRNPDLALKSVQKAIELDGDTDYRYLDALAAAYASGGQFEEAKAAIATAISLAESSTPKDTLDAMLQRQKLYEAGKPYRDVPATGPQPQARRR